MSVNIYNHSKRELEKVAGRVGEGIQLSDVMSLEEIKEASSFSPSDVPSAEAVKTLNSNLCWKLIGETTTGELDIPVGTQELHIIAINGQYTDWTNTVTVVTDGTELMTVPMYMKVKTVGEKCTLVAIGNRKIGLNTASQYTDDYGTTKLRVYWK